MTEDIAQLERVYYMQTFKKILEDAAHTDTPLEDMKALAQAQATLQAQAKSKRDRRADVKTAKKESRQRDRQIRAAIQQGNTQYSQPDAGPEARAKREAELADQRAQAARDRVARKEARAVRADARAARRAERAKKHPAKMLARELLKTERRAEAAKRREAKAISEAKRDAAVLKRSEKAIRAMETAISKRQAAERATQQKLMEQNMSGYIRPRVHKDGTIVYPKKGWEPPPVPDGYERKTTNLKSPDAWTFLPKFANCEHRVPVEGKAQSCGCMAMILHCNRTGKLVEIDGAACPACDLYQ